MTSRRSRIHCTFSPNQKRDSEFNEYLLDLGVQRTIAEEMLLVFRTRQSEQLISQLSRHYGAIRIRCLATLVVETADSYPYFKLYYNLSPHPKCHRLHSRLWRHPVIEPPYNNAYMLKIIKLSYQAQTMFERLVWEAKSVNFVAGISGLSASHWTSL